MAETPDRQTETEVTADKPLSGKEGFSPSDRSWNNQVADAVVAKMAGIAAREVEGVHELGKSFRRLVGRARSGDSLTQGVNVEVGKKEAAIDLVIVMEYGYSIPTITKPFGRT